MPTLALSRRQNARHHLLVDEPGPHVAYLLPGGERRFVPWLGFIERAEARALPHARPVRLADITRIGIGDPPTARRREVSQGHYVHGCLTDEGVYAVYDATVAVVPGPKT